MKLYKLEIVDLSRSIILKVLPKVDYIIDDIITKYCELSSKNTK